MAEEIVYEHVNYKGQPGSLTLNDKVFHYQGNNTKTSVKCSWALVEKRQFSPETANQHRIKVVLVSGKTAVFTVKNRLVLEELRNDMQNRMDAAKIVRIEDPTRNQIMTQIPAAGNDETVIVNMARYNRDYVKGCMDNASRYIAMHKNFKDAAEDLKRGLRNLKLYPDHKAASIEQSKWHEEKAEDRFKANKFEIAYSNYQKAIDALMVKEWSATRCAASACLFIAIPLDIFCVVIGLASLLNGDVGASYSFSKCCFEYACSKALPKEPDDK